jgi:hypothetical protein
VQSERPEGHRRQRPVLLLRRELKRVLINRPPMSTLEQTGH